MEARGLYFCQLGPARGELALACLVRGLTLTSKPVLDWNRSQISS